VPKANSIAVWSGGSAANGHVGFIEKVSGDTVYLNEANFSTPLQYQGYIETLSIDSMANRGNCFIVGYIYPKEKYGSVVATGQVTLSSLTSNLNVRSGSSISSSIVGSLADQTNVTILSKSSNRDKIQMDSYKDYISASYVTITK